MGRARATNPPVDNVVQPAGLKYARSSRLLEAPRGGVIVASVSVESEILGHAGHGICTHLPQIVKKTFVNSSKWTTRLTWYAANAECRFRVVRR